MKNAVEEYERYIKQEIDKLDDDTQQSNLVTKSSGRPGKAGSLINPFEAPGGRVSGDRGRPDVEFTPSRPERTVDIGPDDRGGDLGSGQSFSQKSSPAAQTSAQEEAAGTGSGFGGFGGFNERGRDRDSPRAKGGLMEAPKPKAKKKMKRGGLASKK